MLAQASDIAVHSHRFFMHLRRRRMIHGDQRRLRPPLRPQLAKHIRLSLPLRKQAGELDLDFVVTQALVLIVEIGHCLPS
jgi:hypothetical protein